MILNWIVFSVKSVKDFTGSSDGSDFVIARILDRTATFLYVNKILKRII